MSQRLKILKYHKRIKNPTTAILHAKAIRAYVNKVVIVRDQRQLFNRPQMTYRWLEVSVPL